MMPPRTPPFRPLTPMQVEIAERIGAGLDTTTIAAEMRMKPATVRAHMARIALLIPGDTSPRLRIFAWWHGVPVSRSA